MQLELAVEEINTVLQVLGEMPIKSGLYPLAMKIKEQADAQVHTPAQSTAGTADA